MKVYCGSPATARNYVEADRGRADDYYLAEGTGVAQRYTAGPEAGVTHRSPLTGDAYEAWVAGVDPETGVPKGRLRNDDRAVRFVEVIVNGPKSWSLAAELHSDISVAYDRAQDHAATQIIGWLAQHSTARVGPRGAQVQVPVVELEATTVRHYTSRANDPHRHLHLQINSRVFAEGKWRGLHTVGVRDSIDAINGIGHAAVMTDPAFRSTLAAHGFTLDETGEVVQLREFVGPFSARAEQITRNIDRYEAAWNTAHPGQSPDPAQRRVWDARAWADARPDKVHPAPGTDLHQRWVGELADLGYVDRDRPTTLEPVSVGSLDRDRAVEEVLTRLGAKRSGWNAADVRGEVEQLLARRQIVTEQHVRGELAEDLTARSVARCMPLLGRPGVPEHVRAFSSEQVLAVEADLVGRLATRSTTPSLRQLTAGPATKRSGQRLDAGQLAAVKLLAGEKQLVVIEGAAGSGKTTTLAAARDSLAAQDRRLVVVTPTLKAAKVAEAELGSRAGSAAWLVFQHGFRWDRHGAWTRLEPGQLDAQTGREYAGPRPEAALRAGDLLLVDEAGMLDQDTARALLTVADEQQVRVALVGDRHQLSAVGRGGVLDLATRWADPDACLALASVHRFTRTVASLDGQVEVVPDVEYADLSLAMRSGERPDVVFDALLERGQIRLDASDADRLTALTAEAVDAHTDRGAVVVIADTNEQVTALNNAIRDGLITTGHVDNHDTAAGAGSDIGVGDRVVTRRNDTTLGVANRDAWTVTRINRDGAIVVASNHGERDLPADYVHEHVTLGYASTVHGVQGDTTTAAHFVVGENTGASSAYVGMTRGRQANIAHLIATDVEDAREQWVAMFARDRADLGPSHAAELARQEASRYAEHRPLEEALADLHAAWTTEHDSRRELVAAEELLGTVTELIAVRRAHEGILPAARQHRDDAWMAADAAMARAQRVEAVVTEYADTLAAALARDWDAQREPARQAAHIVREGAGRLGQRRASVRQATEALDEWSAQWQPYLPDLPATTDQLVAYAAGLDNPYDNHETLRIYARERTERAHPELADARSTAKATDEQRRQADAAWGDTQKRLDGQLHPFGRLAYHPNTGDLLTQTEQAIVTGRAQHDEAQHRVDSLLSEPALRSLPPDRITAERERWAAERAAAKAAQVQAWVAQQAAEHAQRFTAHSRGYEPPPMTPDRSPGISR